MYLAYKDTNILFKILPIVLIAIFFVLVFSSFCYGATYTNNDCSIVTNDDLDSEYSHIASFFVYDNSSKKYKGYLLYSNSPFYSSINSGNIQLLTIDGTNPFYLESRWKTTPSFDFSTFDSSTSDVIYTGNGSPNVSSSNASVDNIIYSNYDILDYDTRELVFQQAPQEGALTQMITSMNFSAVIQEVLAILPIVLVVVIGLLGLKKAIQLILQMLRRA